MIDFFHSLLIRNRSLFLFGCANMLAAIVFFLWAQFSSTHIRGANAWLKPFKFALSVGIFSWTMGWYTYELHAPGTVMLYNWVVVLLLSFEVFYISLQAGRGKLSHYNASTPGYAFLANMMGVAAVIVTLWTAYIGVLFWITDFPALPYYYVLSIRAGIMLFVLFAFQGASMGARQTHTVGGLEGGPTLPVLNWSKKYGDLRIAHFIGMHALQVLPLLSWYIFKNSTVTVLAGVLYFLLAGFVFLRALNGKPITNYRSQFRTNSFENSIGK